MHRRLFARLRERVIVGVLVAVASGCAPTLAPSPSPVGNPAEPSPTADVPTSAEQAAIDFRRKYGLRAGLAHVRSVAANPRSTDDEFGLPLTPEELLRLRVRGDSGNAELVVQQRAEAYPEDFCGIYIDRESGAYTSMWLDDMEGHIAAILFQVGPEANVAFVGCTYSKMELRRIQDAIGDDLDWLAEIPARATTIGSSTIENRMHMEISSAVPDAADRVRQHYEQTLNLPADMLVVTSDGTGAALRPRGEVLITVLLPNGQPLGRNQLNLGWGSIDLPGLSCGVGDMGFGVRADGGPTKLPCQEGEWRIIVEGIPGPDEEWEIYGEGRVKVKGGDTSKLTIRLDREPPKPLE